MTKYFGPLSPGDVSIEITVAGTSVTKDIPIPEVSVISVLTPASLSVPNDQRTYARSLERFVSAPTFNLPSDHRIEMAGHAIQVLSAGAWADVTEGTHALGAEARYRYSVNLYDAADALVAGSPYAFFSPSVTTIAHVDPAAIAADAITFLTPYQSASGTEARFTVSSLPTGGTDTVTGIRWRPAGDTGSGAYVPCAVGDTITIALAANTLDQAIAIVPQDGDGGWDEAGWVTQTSKGGTIAGVEDVVLHTKVTSGFAPLGVEFWLETSGWDVPIDRRDIYAPWDFGDAEKSLLTRNPRGATYPWDRAYNVDGAYRIVRGRKVYDSANVLIETLAKIGDLPTGTNVTFLGIDANRAYGHNVAHVYTEPGTYTVEVACTTLARKLAGDLPVTRQVQITVGEITDDPTTRTVCITGVGGALGTEPSGATVYETWLAMMAAERNGAAPLNVLFARGRYHRVTDYEDGWGNTTPTKTRVWSYGTGHYPRLDEMPRTGKARTTGDQHSAGEIEIIGSYDAANPYSMTHRTDTVNLGAPLGGNGSMTIWDFRIVGHQNLYNSVATTNLFMGNVFETNWFNYGMFMEKGTVSVYKIGVFFIQNALAPSGSAGTKDKFEMTAPFIPDHGPDRCSQYLGRYGFTLCDYRSNNSWMGAFQPSIRQGGNGEGDFAGAAIGNNDRVYCELGAGVGGGSFKHQAYPKGHSTYDKIIQVIANESGGDSAVMSFGSSGVYVCNTATIVLPQKRLHGGKLEYWLKRVDDGTIEIDKVVYPDAHPSNQNYGISVFSSTFIDLRDGTQIDLPMIMDDFSFFAFFDNENNVFSVPNRVIGADDSAEPLDTTTVLRTVEMSTYRHNFSRDMSYAVASDVVKTFEPQPTSAAYQVAPEGLVALDDIFGNPRGNLVAKGAFQPEYA